MIKTSTAHYAALLLRVSLGVLFLAHVALKIFVFTVPGFVAYSERIAPNQDLRRTKYARPGLVTVQFQ